MSLLPDRAGRPRTGRVPCGAPVLRPRLPAAFALGALALAACGDDPAGPEPPRGRPTPESPSVEARALWITRFDWTTPGDIEALVDSAAAAGFNLLYFQVRGAADAFYRPGLEPWGQRLTGRLGGDPGWDPLAVALARARARGLELHAWLNAFIGWCGSAPPPESSPRHALLAHPEWSMVGADGQPMPYGPECRWLSPGHPGVTARLAAVAADLARRYAPDGVHLDFIRYPSPAYSFDSASLARYEAARRAEPGLGFDEFRRRLVTAAVREVADSLRAARPATRLSAAVWGIYRNLRGWSGVSTGYEDRFQDARAWAAQGLVDALVPMVYWPIRPVYGDRLDFAYLADEHAAAVRDRHVYIGISLETIDAAELVRQIERARAAGAEGVAILSGRLLRERNLWGTLAAGPFRVRARVPPAPWRAAVLASAALRFERAGGPAPPDGPPARPPERTRTRSAGTGPDATSGSR